MELKRRTFIRRIAALLAAAAGAAAGVGRRVRACRQVEALRARLYPGAHKPLSDAGVRRPGRWLG
ncbi:MAG: hypothetical protein JXR94_11780 [Candidatus Hydrogenedentes bacterium]|nr:hypothetical protein [Candidatus Hydrogenedentota bacterium]